MPFNTHKRQHYSITHHYCCPLKPFMKASRPTCNIWGRSLNVTFPPSWRGQPLDKGVPLASVCIAGDSPYFPHSQ